MRRLIHSEERPIAVAIIAICAAALIYIALHLVLANPQPTVQNPVSPAPCTEDMTCWDCRTMGNHVCGDTPDRTDQWSS